MREDPYTQESFKPLRTNQRFANSENRIKYHNEIARDKRAITRDTDYKLKNNWNILLKQLAGSKRVKRSKEFMLGAGFDFTYFQRTYRKEDDIIYRIYNCGFYITSDSLVNIVNINL